MGCRVAIGEIAEINTAQYSTKERWEHIQYLDTGSVTKGLVSGLQQLNPANDKVPSRARRKVKPGSIVYSMVRPNQEHYALLSDPPMNMLVSTGFSVLDAKRAVVEPNYLYYALTTREAIESFQSLAEQSASTYPTLGVSDLASYEVSLPSLAEQKAVVSILSSLDRKISLNSRLNGYLAA